MLICWSPILATACQNMYMAPNPVDLLIDNFPYFAISEKVKFWTNSSPKRRWLVDHQLFCHFPNMCMGLKPVDPLIDNFSNLANSEKVKFWTSSSPKRCWFVDHQYWHYLRLSISKICVWVRILLICWLAIFQILTSVEKSNFEPIALQNGVDMLITNWHYLRLAIFQICVWV